MRQWVSKGVVRFIAVFCVGILLSSSSTSAFAAAFDAPGDGSSSHPYLITTCQQLQDIGNLLTANYKLMRNIDCSSFGSFSMIGNLFASTAFSGTLDGNHFSIIGLSSSLGGPFGSISGATIKDLQLINSTYSISSTIYAGTLADVAGNSTITDVHSSVTMNGTAPQAGGLIGDATNTAISQSSFTGTINVSGSDTTAGIAALFDGSGSITDSYSSGTISGSTVVGGLVGSIDDSSSIIRSYSASTLGHASGDVGGLVGEVDSPFSLTILDSFSASTLNGGSRIGGIAGEVGMATPTGTSFYDATLAGSVNGCSGDNPTHPIICTAVNIGNTAPNYFKVSSTNAPLNNWDFSSNGAWVTRIGNYPELRSKDAFHSNTFIDLNSDGVNDLTQGTVNTATDLSGGVATFVLGAASHCIDTNSSSWQLGPTFTPTDETKYTVQISSYWQTDIYCRDAGTTIPVTIILDGIYDTSNSVLRYFNPTTSAYSTIGGATFSTVTVGGVPKTAISYTIIEGGPLDPDGTADGFIHDPVALVKVASATATTSTTNSTGVALGVPNTGFVHYATQKISTQKPPTQPVATPFVIAVGAILIIGFAVVGLASRKTKNDE